MDGTFGGLYCAEKWDAHISSSKYAIRFAICHFLHMADLALTRAGLTGITNLRGLYWRKYEPFAWSKILKVFDTCLPFQVTKLLAIDADYYASVALKTFIPLMPGSVRNRVHILSGDEAAKLFPDVLLPPSVTASTYNS